jgi:uncharacterized protein YkwD
MRLRKPYLLGLSGTALCVLSVCLVTPAQSATRAIQRNQALASTRDAIIACTNSERAKHGLSPLRRSRALRRAAQFHANNMSRRHFFAHKDTSGRTPADRVLMFQKHNHFHVIGENIAAGYGSGRSACHSWLVSSTHRHNILDPTYRWIGIGYASGNGGDGTYYVQDFGG